MNKIANIENVVAPPRREGTAPPNSTTTQSRQHSTGSFTRKRCWCSHYRTMADTKEVELMRRLLPPALAPRMDAIMQNAFKGRPTQPLQAPETLGQIWRRQSETARRTSSIRSMARYLTARRPIRCSPRICFHSRPTPDDLAFDRRRTASATNGRITPGLTGTASFLISARSRRMLKREGNARYWAWLLLEACSLHRSTDRADLPRSCFAAWQTRCNQFA